MMPSRIILQNPKFDFTIDRLCQQIIENHDDFSNVCIIGIQDKGVLLAERIYDRLKSFSTDILPKFGKLDITFYRDDFRNTSKPLKSSTTEITFLVDEQKVILVDDVVYTGRTIHSAISALQDFGRPYSVELLCMVDRRFNRHLPIAPNYVGISVDALEEAYVRVYWDGNNANTIFIYPSKNAAIL